MGSSPPTRLLGELTSPEISRYLRHSSILCLPVGAIEQHGPHLPLNTDAVIAEEMTRRIVARWGDELDLWQLPPVCVTLSREHDWAPGTLSLRLPSFIALIEDIAHEIVRSLPARNLVIVNAHGGNRGILENLIRELHGDCAINVCVMHPLDLTRGKGKSKLPDVHGGKAETSLMLALAPHLVRPLAITRVEQKADPRTIEALVFDRGATWPWRSNDPRLAEGGVIGEAHAASRELGGKMIEEIVGNARRVCERLLENQQLVEPERSASALPAARVAPPAPRLRPPGLRARTSTSTGSRPRPRPPRK